LLEDFRFGSVSDVLSETKIPAGAVVV